MMNTRRTGLLFTVFFTGLLFLIVAMSDTVDESAKAFMPANLQSENVQLIDHIGGESKAVFVKGKYAYVSFRSQFAVMNISDPSQPVRIGYMLLPSTIEEIDLLGTYAYVVTNDTDLHVIDISDPFVPVEVGIYQSTSKIYEVVIADSRIYLAEEEGMRILGLSNPIAPNEVAFYDTTGKVLSVAVNGDYAYVAQSYPFPSSSALHIVNIADLPLTQVGVYQIRDRGLDLAVDVVENYAYIGVLAPDPPYWDSHVEIVELSNPAEPVRVASYYLGSNFDFSSITMKVVGQVAYSRTSERMVALDVSNPAEPTSLGDMRPAGSSEDMVITNHYAYIADGPRGLRVVDLAKLMEIGSYEALGIANDVIVKDDYIYVADRGSGGHFDQRWSFGGLKIIKSIPSKMTKVVGFYAANGTGGVAIANDHAYLGNGNCHYRRLDCYGSLTIVDISSPIAPSQIGFGPTIWGSSSIENDNQLPGQVAVNDPYVYVTAPNGLHILDQTSSERGFYDFEGIQDIALEKGYLWAAGSAGLRILELSNPITPTEVSRYETTGQTEGLTIANDRAYLAEGKEGLRILDVSDPFQPSEITSFQSNGFVRDVDVAHDYAFLASGEAGLRVLDISNPALPTEVGFYDTPGDASAVTVEGRYVYVADRQGGLEILQFQHAISGQVRQANGMPFAGVTISASQEMSTTTDATGAYVLSHLSANKYRLTPSLDGYVFSPPMRTMTIPPDKNNEYFVILSAPMSLIIQPNTSTTLTISDTQGLPTSLEFPASSVNLATTLLLTPTLVADYPGFDFTGHAFEVMAVQKGQNVPDFTFNKPVTVTIHYSDDDVRLALNENDLALWWQSNDKWQDATQSCNPPTLYQHDLLNKQISVPICRTGQFALFAPTNHYYLPFVFH